jgi:hypothetical protein
MQLDRYYSIRREYETYYEIFGSWAEAKAHLAKVMGTKRCARSRINSGTAPSGASVRKIVVVDSALTAEAPE